MEATTTPKTAAINRLLPYWAVFCADLKQTLQSWIYRAWVLLSFGAALGFLLYRFGAKQVGGFVQPAPETMSDILSWITLGSITLVIVLTAGTICSERGTMADSILSRGISRYQYFLGKLSARLSAVLGTFLVMACVAFLGSFILLHGESMTISGSIVALAVVMSILVMVTTFGVSVSAMCQSNVLSIAIVWLVLYAGGFFLSLLPAQYPSPDRMLARLPDVLKGFYDWYMVSRLISGALAASLVAALAGMICFSRTDV
jgi:ABC-2 type transport system permease protein